MKSIGLFLFVSTIGVAQTMTMALNSVSAAPGNTASLNLALNAPAGSAPAGLEWTVNAPIPEVQSITATLGPAASAASKSISCSGKTCVISGMNASTIGNGTVAVLTLQLSGTAQGTLAIQLSNTWAASPTAAALGVASSDGQVFVNSPPVSITLAPASITLARSQTQQFSALISGATNTAATWSMSPQVGQLSSSGLYTAPSTIASSSAVTITATSTADPTKAASAIVQLQPDPPVTVTLTPASVTLAKSQTQQFSALISGTTNSAVTWSMSPQVGQIGSAGLFTAPSTIPSNSTVTITARSIADPTKSASGTVNLQPDAPGSVTASDLALGKTATQSSTLGGYGLSTAASSAVDGNTDGNFTHGSVSHTDIVGNPWWQVDLGTSVSISSIAIWNRTDCCGDRLSDYWVFVSNTPFVSSDTPATLQSRAGTWSSHQVGYPNPSTTLAVNAAGRYVRVQLSGTNYLSLAEVQVFGSSPTTYGLSGQVMLSGNGLNGVTMMLSGSQSGSVNTSGSGNYSFAGLPAGGSYIVTPSLSGYSFTPPSQTLSNLSLNQTATFTATPIMYQISGQVMLSGAGLNGVTMTLSGSQSGSMSTNAAGNGSFSGLAAGGSYIVTPSLNGYSFTPPSQTFSNLSASQTATFTASAVATSTGNLALGKAATQSSTLGGYGPSTAASSAVDGNTDGNFAHGSVSHTDIVGNPWWQVDLGTSASISSIAIWNRTDCCSDRLNDYWVFVSNTPFAPGDTPVTLQGRVGTWSSHQVGYPKPSTTIAVNAAGQYVRVQLSGTNYLSLAEVQVFGSSSSAYGLSGQVTLSGVGLNGVTMTLSGSQSASWSTSGSGNYSFAGLAAGGSYIVTPSLSGYSFTPPSQTFSNLSASQTATFTANAVITSTGNLALGKAATQSSTLAGYGVSTAASSAVDGRTDGNFVNGSVSHTDIIANPWWQVDLGATANISSIAIWNRTDCCGDRLSDYWVFVSNTPFGPSDTPATLQSRAGTWSSHQVGYPNPSSTIAVNAAGQYVRVQLSGTNYLSLAEVQVFGSSSATTTSP